MVTGRRMWHVVGCYISPINTSTIYNVTASIRDRTYGDKLMVAGNLNANLSESEGTPQGKSIVDELAAAGIVDMGLHLIPQHKPWL